MGLAERRAAALARQGQGVALPPSDDAAELVASFRRPDPEGASPAPEPPKAPAAAAPAAAALRRGRGHREGTCEHCEAPILWVRTPLGNAQPCDPRVLRAVTRVASNARREREPGWVPGRDMVLFTDDGVAVACNEDPDGPVVGRRSHYEVCPAATRARMR